VGVFHGGIENLWSTWNLPLVTSCGSTGSGFILTIQLCCGAGPDI